MMNEFYSMSKEKAFITKTLMLIEQYDELAADKPASAKLEMTLRLNCMLGLLIIPQQKLNNSKMIRIGSKDLWGVEVEEIDFFPHPGLKCKLPLKVSQSKIEVRQLVETRWGLRS